MNIKVSMKNYNVAQRLFCDGFLNRWNLNPRKRKMKILLRQASKLLSKKQRFKIFRSRLKLDYNPPENFVVKIATTKRELEQAFELAYGSYVDSGLMKMTSSGMRITPYHTLPSTSVVVIKLGRQVISTMTIIKDSPLGLPVEKIADISNLKRPNRCVAEISSLCVKREFRNLHGKYVFPLFKYMYEYCTDYIGVDDVVIAVNPAHIELYEAVFEFQRIQSGEIDNYTFVNGAKAIVAHLDLHNARERAAKTYAGKHPTKNFYEYVCEWKPDYFKFPEMERFSSGRPLLKPNMLDYFFKQRTKVLDDLSMEERQLIASMYKNVKYKAVFEVPTADQGLDSSLQVHSYQDALRKAHG